MEAEPRNKLQQGEGVKSLFVNSWRKVSFSRPKTLKLGSFGLPYPPPLYLGVSPKIYHFLLLPYKKVNF